MPYCSQASLANASAGRAGLDKCGERCYSEYHQVAYGNSPYGLRPWKGISMSKFELPTESALEGALHNALRSGDFLQEVAAAIDDDRKVVINGKNINIESPEGGPSTWELAEFFTAPPSNPAADVLYKFVRR